MNTATIHRCAECGHQHVDHAAAKGGGRCSMGGYCPCSLTSTEVQRANPPVEVPTFPGYNQQTGQWA